MALIQHGDKLTALQVMQDAPVIPVIVLHDIQHAVPLARALVAGGIRMLEVTVRTPQALASLEAIAREVPEAVAGAGTVRSAADVQASLQGELRVLVADAEWAARTPAEMPEALRLSNSMGIGRELFTGMRRQALTAEEGAASWL